MALINTTRGMMEESLLEKRTGTIDNEIEKTDWVEYWLDGELVHRSANMFLKPAAANAAAQSF